MTKKRNEVLDILKGLLIFLVIYGHAIQALTGDGLDFYDNYIFKLIYSFHMPLFMMISGYLFYTTIQKYDYKKIVYKKTRTILIPALLFGGFIGLFSFAFGTDHSIGNFIYDMVYGLTNFWFLIAVFILSLMCGFINKYLKDSKIIYFILFLLTFFIPYGGPYLFMYFFFVLGYLINKYEKKFILPNNLYIIGFMSILYFICMNHFEKNTFVYISGMYIFNKEIPNVLGICLYRFFIALLGCDLVVRIVNYIREKNLFKNTFAFLSRIGKNTIYLYILSTFLVTYGFVVIRLPIYSSILYFLYTITLAILITHFIYHLNEIFKTCKLWNIVFGTNKKISIKEADENMEKWKNWNDKTDNFKKYENIKSNKIYGEFRKKVPYVSIMILTYKRADGLEKALISALNQDYKDYYEIVVCDDSGFDKETDELMKKYCKKYNNIIYYRHEKNLGQYANWNRACELCRTEWYCLLHDDDMLKPDYLTCLTKAVENEPQAGLAAVYVEVNDLRDDADKPKQSFSKKILQNSIAIAVKIFNNKVINIKIKDNLKHIFVMNSTFINKKKAMEIGGLDDKYYPSSDFFFCAKMAHYYKTLFLPKRLTSKGIMESESLKLSVCEDSIKCAYYLSYNIAENLNYSKRRCKRYASLAAVAAEIGVKGYNDVDYGYVKDELGMSKIYNNKIAICLINLWSKFNWGMLMFRRK